MFAQYDQLNEKGEVGYRRFCRKYFFFLTKRKRKGKKRRKRKRMKRVKSKREEKEEKEEEYGYSLEDLRKASSKPSNQPQKHVCLYFVLCETYKDLLC